jgi:hypothetical protein
LFILHRQSFAASVTVVTPAEFEAALAKNDPPWTEILLNAPIFEHTTLAYIDIKYSSTASPLTIGIHTDQRGDVLIKPAVDKRVRIWANKDSRGCDVTIAGRKDPNGTIQRIKFVEGTYASSGTVEVASWYAGTGTTRVQFDYVDFCGNTGNNGFEVAPDPVEDVDVTFNYCRAYDNKRDGWSLPASSSNRKYITARLNECEAYNQNPERLNDLGFGDGVTNHSSYGRVLISGWTFYDNGKAGISHAAGFLHVSGATFYGNGAALRSNGDVFVGAGTHAVIDNCRFKHLDNQRSGQCHIRAVSSRLHISNCLFHEQTDGNTGSAILIEAGTYAVVENNVFSGFNTPSNYFVIQEEVDFNGLLMVRNNTFYNCGRGIRTRDFNTVIFNNIFHSMWSYGVYSDPGNYHLHPANGFNLFFRCPYRVNGETRPSDMTEIDPRLVDPAGGDYRLRPNSPCLNTGKPTLAVGFTDIGAWQGPSVFIELPENCTAALPMDLNDDCKVDLLDLAMLAEGWLECNLEPPEVCWGE